MDFFFDFSFSLLTSTFPFVPTISASTLTRVFLEPCRTRFVNCFKGQGPVHSGETANMVCCLASMHALVHSVRKKRGEALDDTACVYAHLTMFSQFNAAHVGPQGHNNVGSLMFQQPLPTQTDSPLLLARRNTAHTTPRLMWYIEQQASRASRWLRTP